MSGSKIVNDLYKFLQEGVTLENLQKSTDKAFEGKLPKDPSKAEYDQIQKLAEETEEVEEAKKESDAKKAEETETPVKSKIQKDMDKATPNVDKLSDAEKQKGADKVKDVKKKDPKVTGVKKESVEEITEEEKEDENVEAIKAANKSEQDAINKKAVEGKLPKDPSEATHDQIQTLAEERVLTTVSDEDVAKDLQSKYPGSRIVTDNVDGKNQYIIMVKEGEELKEADKVEECGTVTIDAEDKEVVVSTEDGVTVVTTTDKEDLEAEVVEEPIPADDGMYDDEMAMEMAEKIFLSDYLKKKETLSEKEQKFVDEVTGIELSEANKAKVDEKLAELQKEQ